MSACVRTVYYCLHVQLIVTNSTRSRRSPYGSGLVSTPSTPGPSGSFDCRTDGREFGLRSEGSESTDRFRGLELGPIDCWVPSVTHAWSQKNILTLLFNHKIVVDGDFIRRDYATITCVYGGNQLSEYHSDQVSEVPFLAYAYIYITVYYFILFYFVKFISKHKTNLGCTI